LVPQQIKRLQGWQELLSHHQWPRYQIERGFGKNEENQVQSHQKSLGAIEDLDIIGDWESEDNIPKPQVEEDKLWESKERSDSALQLSLVQ